MLDDTIAAIATPVGEGGIAVIRISGATALEVADQVFRPGSRRGLSPSQAESHTIHYGRAMRNDAVLDEVMVAVMRAPRTFTREHVVEISTHGGILPARVVLEAVLAAGARLALPGEFTRRAFLNGRIDLAQAEAVVDVIHSRTELALAAANEQLSGKLSQRINDLRDALLRTLAHIEAHIDFPDEDIAPDTRAHLIERMRQSNVFIDQLLRTAHEGQVLRRGVRAAIIGRPNAGKSSLLNQLLGQERAIVSAIPGTTRDTIEETANIRGVPVIFVDTAGLRASTDEIEIEGIRRSHQASDRAEIILHVLDHSTPLEPEDARHLEQFAGKRRILVRNKADLPEHLHLPEGFAEEAVAVSCLTGAGIENLKDVLERLIWSGAVPGEMNQVMINTRHQDALRRARESLVHTLEAMETQASLELVAMDLRIAVNAVGEVVGKTTTEDLLDSIFSQFCIGK